MTVVKHLTTLPLAKDDEVIEVVTHELYILVITKRGQVFQVEIY
jgi:hypothetical protein